MQEKVNKITIIISYWIDIYNIVYIVLLLHACNTETKKKRGAYTMTTQERVKHIEKNTI